MHVAVHTWQLIHGSQWKAVRCFHGAGVPQFWGTGVPCLQGAGGPRFYWGTPILGYWVTPLVGGWNNLQSVQDPSSEPCLAIMSSVVVTPHSKDCLWFGQSFQGLPHVYTCCKQQQTECHLKTAACTKSACRICNHAFVPQVLHACC